MPIPRLPASTYAHAGPSSKRTRPNARVSSPSSRADGRLRSRRVLPQSSAQSLVQRHEILQTQEPHGLQLLLGAIERELRIERGQSSCQRRPGSACRPVDRLRPRPSRELAEPRAAHRAYRGRRAHRRPRGRRSGSPSRTARPRYRERAWWPGDWRRWRRPRRSGD